MQLLSLSFAYTQFLRRCTVIYLQAVLKMKEGENEEREPLC